MTRTLRTSMFAIALLCGCKDEPAQTEAAKAAATAAAGAAAAAALAPVFVSADSGKLIPDAATLVGGVDVRSLVVSSVYTSNKALIEKEAKEMLDAASACSIGLEKFTRITFGVDPKTEGYAAVVEAKGVGKAETLSCIHGKVKAKERREPWTVEERDGRTVLMMADRGIGFVVSDDVVAFASKSWGTGLEDRLAGRGKSAFDGALKDVIGRADSGKTIWVAGAVPVEALVGTPAAGAKDVAGTIELTSGVALSASVGFGSAEEATKRRDELLAQFEGVKGVAAGVGVPQAIIDSVEIIAAGAAVVVSVQASDADIRKLQETAMKAL